MLCLSHVVFGAPGTVQHSISDDAYERCVLRGQQARSTGRILEALSQFQHAAEIAHAFKDFTREAKALNSATGAQIRLFRYRDALYTANLAREVAFRANDLVDAGGAANNRATIYEQVGDFASAANAGKEAVQLLEKSPRQDYFASALLNYGDILIQLGQTSRSIAVLQRAVSVAHAANAASVEALADDHLGDSLGDVRQFESAEEVLNQGLQLHLKLKDNDAAAVTRASIGALAYSQGKFAYALELLDASVATRSIALETLPPYWAEHERGRILLALGRKAEALAHFRRAVYAARLWRRSSLPADATSTRTAVALHEVYRDYISLAAQLGISGHNTQLVRDALNALVESRAANLREQTLSAWQREMRLPPRYFELLSELQVAQAAVTLGVGSKDMSAKQARLDQLRLELTELENGIGLQQHSAPAMALQPVSIISVQRHLGPRELLLSYCLGPDRSFLWAVTDDNISAYELPAADKLNWDARSFAHRMQTGGSVQSGVVLAQELFGKLDPKLARRTDWLIAGDGALLDSIPLSSLPNVAGAAPVQAIVSAHSLRLIPSELLLAGRRTGQPPANFVGVADPIYNFADVRRSHSVNFAPARPIAPHLTLARLVGSEREVRSAAALTGFSGVAILSGPDSTVRNLRSVLAAAPEVLHFAVHVVSPQGPNGSSSPDEAALALSLDDHGVPELVTKETIATLHVPGSLVVLSGCASQQGENLPSAGMIGLSRAWLLAGASAVLVSAWPMPDDSGQFFSVFYHYLQAQPGSGSLASRAAAALRQTQTEMLHLGDYRSQPSFWAAYSLISKE